VISLHSLVQKRYSETRAMKQGYDLSLTGLADGGRKAEPPAQRIDTEVEGQVPGLIGPG